MKYSTNSLPSIAKRTNGVWGFGVMILNLCKRNIAIGDWGLGIGDWGLGPIPNPNPQSQSPIPRL